MFGGVCRGSPFVAPEDLRHEHHHDPKDLRRRKKPAIAVLFGADLARRASNRAAPSMNLDEKIEVALLLEEMGVDDVIEGRLPITSNGDFEAVRETPSWSRTRRLRSGVAGRMDIDRAWEAVSTARRPRIHTFIATSPLHMN